MAPFNMALCLSGLTGCFGQNPASPYTGPRWSRSPSGSLSSEGGGAPGLSVETLLLGTFTLTANQAVVVWGRTPPPCAYFGLTPYLFSSPSKCGDQPLFATIADTTNANSFRALWPNEAKSPFNLPFFLIYSANLTLGNYLLRTMTTQRRRGIFMPIKRRLPDDLYLVVGRAAGFSNPADEARYLQNPGQSIAVVSGGSAFAAGPYQTTSIWKPRNAVGNEDEVKAQLMDVTRAVETAVGQSAGVPYWTAVPTYVFMSDIGYDTGDDCINHCTNCRGDNRDAVYRLADFPRVGPKDVLLVVGVNHNRTGKSTYTNLSVYDVDRELGLDSVDTYDTTAAWIVLVVAREPCAVSAELRAYNPRLILIGPDVVNVNITERTYLQPGVQNISPTPSSLVPFEARRGVSTLPVAIGGDAEWKRV